MTDDQKFNSTMNLNIPTDYGRFTTTKPSSSPLNTTRDGNITSRRYQSNGKNKKISFQLKYLLYRYGEFISSYSFPKTNNKNYWLS